MALKEQGLSLGLKEKMYKMSLEHIAKLDCKKLWKTMWSCPKDIGLNLKESPTVHSQENLELNKKTTAKDWIHKCQMTVTIKVGSGVSCTEYEKTDSLFWRLENKGKESSINLSFLYKIYDK